MRLQKNATYNEPLLRNKRILSKTHGTTRNRYNAHGETWGISRLIRDRITLKATSSASAGRCTHAHIHSYLVISGILIVMVEGTPIYTHVKETLTYIGMTARYSQSIALKLNLPCGRLIAPIVISSPDSPLHFPDILFPRTDFYARVRAHKYARDVHTIA